MPQLPDLSGLGTILQLVVAFLGAYFLAIWVSLTVWAFRDIRSRTRDIMAILLAVVLVLAFNLPGLLLYILLRPRETLAERNERELAEEALLQDIQERQECPVCHLRSIQPDYLICPSCHTRLRKKCEHCGRVLNLKWSVCPYCESGQTMVSTRERLAEAPPPPRPRYAPPAGEAPVPVARPQPAFETRPAASAPAAPSPSLAADPAPAVPAEPAPPPTAPEHRTVIVVPRFQTAPTRSQPSAERYVPPSSPKQA